MVVEEIRVHVRLEKGEKKPTAQVVRQSAGVPAELKFRGPAEQHANAPDDLIWTYRFVK